jgi:hypothetical protein
MELKYILWFSFHLIRLKEISLRISILLGRKIILVYASGFKISNPVEIENLIKINRRDAVIL